MNNYRPQGFSFLPLVVKNLLIINGLLFLATYVFKSSIGLDLTEYLALYYPGSAHFRPYQFITHLFMHGSLFHIFSNMFALWMFGTAIENVWGPKRFLIFYIVTGLGAALLHTAVNYVEISNLQSAIDTFKSTGTPAAFESFVFNSVPSEFKSVFVQVSDAWNASPASISLKENAYSLTSELVQYKMNIPTVGASGAVFGVLLAFGMMFPNAMIYVFLAIPIRAKYFVILYGLFELYSGIQNNPGDNVAHFAHLGGMLFGFILIKYWNRNRHRWN